MELPEGIVTFLFSDIEGSTRLLERFGARLTDAVTRHHELMVAAVSGERGVVFETIGDAVYAAFADPADSVRAAVAAQRAMAHEPWGELGPIRVLARIALEAVAGCSR